MFKHQIKIFMSYGRKHWFRTTFIIKAIFRDVISDLYVLQTDGTCKSSFKGAASDDGKKDRRKKSKIEDDPWMVMLKLVGLIAVIYLLLCSVDCLRSSFQLMLGRIGGIAVPDTVQRICLNPLLNLLTGALIGFLFHNIAMSMSVIVVLMMSSMIPVSSAFFILAGIITRALLYCPITLIEIEDNDEKKKNHRKSSKATSCMSDIASILFCTVSWLGFLYVLSALVKPFCVFFHSLDITKFGEIFLGFVKAITNPLTSKIIQIDQSAIKSISEGNYDSSMSIIKHVCSVNEFNKGTCVHLFEWVSRVDGGGWSDATVGFLLMLMSLACSIVCVYVADKLLCSALQSRIALALKVVICDKLTAILKRHSGDVIVPVITGLLVLVSESYTVALIGTLLAGFAAVYVKRLSFPLQKRSVEIPMIGRFHDNDGKVGVVLQMAVCQAVYVFLW